MTGGACTTASVGEPDRRTAAEILASMEKALDRFGHIGAGLDLGRPGGERTARGIAVLSGRMHGRVAALSQALAASMANLSVAGLAVWQSSLLYDMQVPARRHKKRRNQTEAYHRRVQKKWLKRFGTVEPAFLVDVDKLFGFRELDVKEWMHG